MQGLTPKEEMKLRIAYKQTFGTEEGRAVLEDLQGRCFKYQTTVVPNDPQGTHVNEGARQILLTIEELMSDEGIKRLEESSGEEQ